jgi:hypothetical protein
MSISENTSLKSGNFGSFFCSQKSFELVALGFLFWVAKLGKIHPPKKRAFYSLF